MVVTVVHARVVDPLRRYDKHLSSPYLTLASHYYPLTSPFSYAPHNKPHNKGHHRFELEDIKTVSPLWINCPHGINKGKYATMWDRGNNQHQSCLNSAMEAWIMWFLAMVYPLLSSILFLLSLSHLTFWSGYAERVSLCFVMPLSNSSVLNRRAISLDVKRSWGSVELEERGSIQQKLKGRSSQYIEVNGILGAMERQESTKVNGSQRRSTEVNKKLWESTRVNKSHQE